MVRLVLAVLLCFIFNSCKSSTASDDKADLFKVLFHTDEGNSGHIYLFDASTGSTSQLTSADGINAFPEVLPDEEKILYMAPVNGRNRLATMNVTNRQPAFLTTNSEDELLPRLSISGNLVAFLHSPGSSFQYADLEVYDLSGTRILSIDSVWANRTRYDITEDDQSIVYNIEVLGQSEIFIRSFADSISQNISNSINSNDRFPKILPGANKVIYHSSNRPSANGLYMMNLDGSNQEFLTSIDGNDSRAFDIAMNGRQIVYVKDGDIYLYNLPEKSSVQVFSDSGISPAQQRISKNGQKIVFQGFGSGINNQDIYVLNSDGSNLIKITEDDPSRLELYPRFLE